MSFLLKVTEVQNLTRFPKQFCTCLTIQAQILANGIIMKLFTTLRPLLQDLNQNYLQWLQKKHNVKGTLCFMYTCPVKHLALARTEAELVWSQWRISVPACPRHDSLSCAWWCSDNWVQHRTKSLVWLKWVNTNCFRYQIVWKWSSLLRPQHILNYTMICI